MKYKDLVGRKKGTKWGGKSPAGKKGKAAKGGKDKSRGLNGTGGARQEEGFDPATGSGQTGLLPCQEVHWAAFGGSELQVGDLHPGQSASGLRF